MFRYIKTQLNMKCKRYPNIDTNHCKFFSIIKNNQRILKKLKSKNKITRFQ